jgi:transposase
LLHFLFFPATIFSVIFRESTMYIRVTSTPNSPRKSVKVVESIREGFKVKQVMILHVGVASNENEIEKLKQIGKEFVAQEELRREKSSPQSSLFETETMEERLNHIKKNMAHKKRGRKSILKLQNVTAEDQISLADLVEEKRVIEGFHDIAGHVYDLLNYQTLLPRKKDNEILKDLVLMRLAEPSSKLKTQQILDASFSKTHNLDSIYRVMDKLFPKIDNLKKKTFQRTQKILPETIDILFFDCTTLYFESTETDEMRQFGYSKDHRFNTTQVVLALATNSDGLPIGYELFEGNKAEVKTLLTCLNSWKKLFNIQSVCFVADRAMMSDDNLKMLEKENHHYVIAAKLRALPAKLTSEILSEKNYQAQMINEDFGWIGEFDYKERRLIVSYKTGRASRDSYQRDQIIQKLKKRIGDSGDTKKLITNQGVKKFTRSENSKTIIDQDKIDRDSAWDGLHGVITNIPEERAHAILARYSQLWKIEESFRINKHTLSMRPIYHYKPERIKAHIALCFMAFSVLRHMEYHVKLTQKITLNGMIDELTHVQASYYRHLPTGKVYRMPGKFSQNAAKIYKSFQVQRNNNAQVVV